MRSLTIAVALLGASACGGTRVPRHCAEATSAGASGAAALPHDVPQFDHLGTVVGTVREAATGRAVAGAEVTLVPRAPTGGRSAAAAPPATRADSLGRFVLIGAPAAGMLRVRAPGGGSAERPVVLVAERVETVHVALGAAAGCPGAGR